MSVLFPRLYSKSSCLKWWSSLYFYGSWGTFYFEIIQEPFFNYLGDAANYSFGGLLKGLKIGTELKQHAITAK